MRDSTQFGTADLNAARGSAFALICLAMLATGCSKSETASDTPPTSGAHDASGSLDTSRLPRVAGAKETFASAATTIYTAPTSIEQTADAIGKALAAAAWQRYVSPSSAQTDNPNLRNMTFKKGPQALNVFITLAPAQGNATSVNYTAAALAHDLPFPKDASDIAFDPSAPQLNLVTANDIDSTLKFYRKELGALGWPLWSRKDGVNQPPGSNVGEITEKGAYAIYYRDNQFPLLLLLQRGANDKINVDLKQVPDTLLNTVTQAQQAVGTAIADAAGGPGSQPAMSAREQLDVSRLPRLDGAMALAASSPTQLSYSVPGPVADVVAATKRLLAADGWKSYASPSENSRPLGLDLKKGSQGLSVSFYMPPGEPVHSGVDYRLSRLDIDLPFPDDATDIVFDERRPYLNCVTAGTIDAALALFDKQLAAMGWSRLSATAALARWPNANLDEKVSSGALVYYIHIGENPQPISLSLQRTTDGKTKVEIKIPPFAQPQVLKAGQDLSGLPTPYHYVSASSSSGDAKRELNALVPAEVGTLLAFYRRELTARNWKEDTRGAAVNSDSVMLTFSSAEGTAVLKLGHRYDLTTVNLALQVSQAVLAAKAKAEKDLTDQFLKDAEAMTNAALSDASRLPWRRWPRVPWNHWMRLPATKRRFPSRKQPSTSISMARKASSSSTVHPTSKLSWRSIVPP